MRFRNCVSWDRLMFVVVAIAVVGLLTPPLTAAQTAASDTGSPDRTPWGHPDLQGVWNFNTNTPLERSSEFEERQFLTDEELAEREEQAVEQQIDRPPRDGDPGTYNRFWTDQPRANRRTSMIVDPPDGRLPPLTPEGQRFQRELEESRRDVQDDEPTPGGWVTEIGPHGLSVRCILGFNSGPPMSGRSYNANVHVFQTPDAVVLVNEMIHNARIIPLDGRPHLSPVIRQRVGDSRGRWDGDTLVVETTNFTSTVLDFANDRPAGPAMKVIERFSMGDDGLLLYRFTIDDPDFYSQPWTAELDMVRSEHPLYEYACHEGNLSVPNILAGARASDRSED